MTHRARENFLAFTVAPPSLHRSLVLRQHPRSKRRNQLSHVLPHALLRVAGCLGGCSLSFANSYSTVKFYTKTRRKPFFGDTLCLLVAKRNPNLPSSSFQHLELAITLPRSQLCDARDESALLRPDILGTRWTTTWKCSNSSAACYWNKRATELNADTEEREENAAQVAITYEVCQLGNSRLIHNNGSSADLLSCRFYLLSIKWKITK